MENDVEIIWNFPILDLIWRGKSGYLQFGWILLLIALLATVAAGILFIQRNKRYSLVLLIGKVLSLSSAMFCGWGLSSDVVNSANSIDNPRLDIVENMAVAEAQAIYSIGVFVTGFALIFMAAYIFEYIDKKRGDAEQPG